jgi:hypothetical protein
MITEGKARFGQAMVATLGRELVYFIILYGVVFFLGASLGTTAGLLGLGLALIAWLAVHRASFDTSWGRALGRWWSLGSSYSSRTPSWSH